MQQFTKGAPIARHEANCSKMPAQVIQMPVNDPVTGDAPELKFYPGRKRFKNAIIGFCDFEAANFRRARKVPGKKERRMGGKSNTTAAAAAAQSFTVEGLAAAANKENAAVAETAISDSSSSSSGSSGSGSSGSGGEEEEEEEEQEAEEEEDDDDADDDGDDEDMLDMEREVLEDVMDEVMSVEEEEELARREDAEPGKSFT
jgi:hypothetical protein